MKTITAICLALALCACGGSDPADDRKVIDLPDCHAHPEVCS